MDQTQVLDESYDAGAHLVEALKATRRRSFVIMLNLVFLAVFMIFLAWRLFNGRDREFQELGLVLGIAGPLLILPAILSIIHVNRLGALKTKADYEKPDKVFRSQLTLFIYAAIVLLVTQLFVLLRFIFVSLAVEGATRWSDKTVVQKVGSIGIPLAVFGIVVAAAMLIFLCFLFSLGMNDLMESNFIIILLSVGLMTALAAGGTLLMTAMINLYKSSMQFKESSGDEKKLETGMRFYNRFMLFAGLFMTLLSVTAVYYTLVIYWVVEFGSRL